MTSRASKASLIVAVVGGVLCGLFVATVAVAIERSLPLPAGERHYLAIEPLDASPLHDEPLPALVAPAKNMTMLECSNASCLSVLELAATPSTQAGDTVTLSCSLDRSAAAGDDVAAFDVPRERDGMDFVSAR